MTSLQVARPHCQMDKSKITISAVKESASCSHGWLRCTVQYIFGAITIISFILIVFMAMTNNNTTKRRKEERCTVYGCRIICYNVPYFGSYFTDLSTAVRQSESSCSNNIIVVLNEPMFSNYTVTRQLFSHLRHNIDELEIVGGNMKNIAPNTFAERAASRIQRLHFENVIINDWESDTLIGLNNLKEICVEKSYIFNINENALQAVDNTLTTLSVKDSGYWDPTNFTGCSNLEDLKNVYFSCNNFNNILNRNSFRKLKRCRVLYLDSCRINAIGPGTFDYLHEIEMLFLNNNFLIILPDGIFSSMMAMNPRPRVNLEDNQWFCECSMTELRNWSDSGLLLVDALCYYPPNFRDYPFSLLEMECGNETYVKSNKLDFIPSSNIDAILTGRCNDDQQHGRSAFISPNRFLGCTDAQYYGARYSQHALPPVNMSIKRTERDKIIKARYAMQSDHLSMIEITSLESPTSKNYGLMWYQMDCPGEIHCVGILPRNLRVYNVENNVAYTFCPLLLRTGEIVSDQCVDHTFEATNEMTVRRMLTITFYGCSGILGTFVGACILYTVIRKFPHLLKGSDRILFVKHKNVEALVMPPKVPLRERASLESKSSPEINAIFTLPDTKFAQTFIRMKSTRSNKSAAPSYISAMQPTEEQLAEWRLRHHFDNNLTITSVGLDVPYSLLFDNESMYCSIGQTSTNTDNESLKNNK